MSLSAYVSLYEDAGLLGPALASVAPFVDEIVVVDGAYGWMVPLLEGDTTRSGPETMTALAPYGDRVRHIAGMWANELEKRVAGYEACRGRHVLRLDADEVLMARPGGLERWREAGYGVGQMGAPLFVTPDWLQGPAGGGALAPLGVLFDREQVGAWEHLAYLWLELPAAERGQVPAPDPALIDPERPGLLAHLTSWRMPEAAARRARFYILNYIRSEGRWPLLPEYDPGREGLAGIGRRLGTEVLRELCLSHPIVTGGLAMADAELRPVPAEAPRAVLEPLWEAFLAGQAAANAELGARGRWFGQGEIISLDATRPGALPALGPDGVLRVELSEPVERATVRVQWLVGAPPWSIEEAGTVVGHGRTVELTLPESPGGPVLRQIVSLQFWMRSANPIGRFRLIPQ